MTDTVLAGGAIEELRGAIHGELITPGDPGYDEARKIWNDVHDRHPAVIVRCAGAADVMRAIELARSEDLPLAVRGGGHSIPGYSTNDGGVVIDMSAMRGVRVDPDARRAVAQAGATWADFDHETQAFGLAVTGGLVSTTGIAGFTLGGGIGWLMRKHGLTADNLVSADMVTAEGRLVHASENENQDLFWALRGGGGNFGVVTAFEYRLHPVGPTVYGGAAFYPGERAREILRAYRDLVSDMPDELTTMVNLTTAPPVPFLPEEVHGKPVVAIVGAHAGTLEDGEAAMAPVRAALGEPVADLFGPIPYVALQSLLDPLFAKGARNYMRSGFLHGIDDETIETLLEFYEKKSSPTSEIHVQHLDGAVGRVAPDATAFRHRRSPFLFNVVGRWTDPAEDQTHYAWGRALHLALEPHADGGVYVNFLDSEGDARVREAYGEDTYARLQAVKDRYDPTNLFRLNQNIRPSA